MQNVCGSSLSAASLLNVRSTRGTKAFSHHEENDLIYRKDCELFYICTSMYIMYAVNNAMRSIYIV